MNRITAILAGCLLMFGNVQAQSVPSIRGHSPGELWSKIGRGLPCSTSMTSDSMGLFVLHRAQPLKLCDAANGVALGFMRDTLFLVILSLANDTVWYNDNNPASDTVTVQSWWLAQGRAQGNEWFGEPDSVVSKPNDMGTAGYDNRITAYWQSNTSPRWAAWFFVHKERFTTWSEFSASVILCGELTTNVSCDLKNPFPLLADSVKTKQRPQRRRRP